LNEKRSFRNALELLSNKNRRNCVDEVFEYNQSSPANFSFDLIKISILHKRLILNTNNNSKTFPNLQINYVCGKEHDFFDTIIKS